MIEKAISWKLVKNIKKIYEETKSRVQVGKEKTEGFWTTKGLRQGCPLSPLLFILHISEIKDYLRRRQEGEITIGRKRFCTIVYADDLAIVAESESEMKKMISYLKNWKGKKRSRIKPKKIKNNGIHEKQQKNGSEVRKK